ncbi:MAG: hypothetical protein U0946_05455, partial [Patescibacteria group bacterium]|nr:hypothetical protein [Patescibacteria group bacterium]
AGNSQRTRIVIFAAGDVLFGFGLTLWLFRDLNLPLLIFTIFLTQLPDWMEMPYFFWGIKLAPSVWVKKMQSRMHSRLRLPWGLVTQIALLIPLLWWTLT